MVYSIGRIFFVIVFFALVMFAADAVTVKNDAICAPNEDGGYVILTQYPTGPSGELLAVYTSINADSEYGYWVIDGSNRVIVSFLPGSYEYYYLGNFMRCSL